MSLQSTQRVLHVTGLITVLAIVFFLFFQVNKGGPLREINPFGEDPYDALGSFAIQAAILIGSLTYARALRLREEAAQMVKLRLILRGNGIVLVAILVTLIADGLAILLHPLPASIWGTILLIELGIMWALALAACAALIVVFRPFQTPAAPRDLTLADGLDDLWALVRIPVIRASALLPSGLVQWVGRFNSDRLFRKLPWIDPRMHSWRFAGLLGLLAGVALYLAQFQEGLPPSLAAGLLLAGIFMGGELVATLLGYAILGGYLGLRPALGGG